MLLLSALNAETKALEVGMQDISYCPWQEKYSLGQQCAESPMCSYQPEHTPHFVGSGSSKGRKLPVHHLLQPQVLACSF